MGASSALDPGVVGSTLSGGKVAGASLLLATGAGAMPRRLAIRSWLANAAAPRTTTSPVPASKGQLRRPRVPAGAAFGAGCETCEFGRRGGGGASAVTGRGSAHWATAAM